MSMEELWAAIASDVAEELKTLTEVVLMKPSQGKDPILDLKKDPHDGGKRPIGGGEVPSVPIEVKPGGPHYPRPYQYRDPIGGVEEPDTGGLKQKIDKPKGGGKKPVKPYKRPIGSGDVPGIPIYTCGGPKWEDFKWPTDDEDAKEPTDAEIIKAGIDFIMDTDFGGE